VNVLAKHVGGPYTGKKVLVANRGEIACRIFRAAKALGLKTVAVFTKEDADSNHAHEADEAFQLELPKTAKPGDAVAPYLDVDQVIAIAKKSQATLVHPGYGFLAENVDFASKLEKNKITFVGPSAKCIDMFGDKTQSKNFAIKCDVKVAKGSGLLKDAEHLKKFVKDEGMI